MFLKKIAVLTMLVFALAVQAQTAAVWQDLTEGEIVRNGERRIIPEVYRTLFLDVVGMQEILETAPVEGQDQVLTLALPRPDGGFSAFDIVASPVMDPALAARFPEIQTYMGQGTVDKRQVIRLDLTPHGFHAMVRGPEGAWFIDPYMFGDRDYAISYFRRDYRRPDAAFTCSVEEGPELFLPETTRIPIAGELLSYRTAVACTGEYANFHGGTVQLALAAIVTSINRVNMIYETDVAIRHILIANNDQIIFTNASTDPYTNNDGFAMLSQNQATLDSLIGSANYDVGHVFSTGGGGVASLASTCVNGLKARGVTGRGQPIGDPFDVDYVAHEMGHQWGGSHTFNGTTSNCGGGNRSAGSAYEPGSASTIMGYAGICGAEDLQPNSDPYFHVRSYDQIVAHSRNGSGTCGVSSAVANSAPVVDAGHSFVIPQSTPFTLSGSATDNEGDKSLTYCWEQFDLGTASPPMTDNGNRPIFRTFNPVDNGQRTIPNWSDILGNTQTIGESPAITSRSLTFRLTVRDNNPGGGGVDYATVVHTVTANAGPFLVTAPNTSVSWTGNQSESISWDVANTDGNEVNCSQVDVLLSTDGGTTFSLTVASNLPNNGSAVITVPNVDTNQARLMVKCSDNIFFDVSNTNFTIVASSLACTGDYNNWLAPTEGLFIDSNGNGIVDIIDILLCQPL